MQWLAVQLICSCQISLFHNNRNRNNIHLPKSWKGWTLTTSDIWAIAMYGNSSAAASGKLWSGTGLSPPWLSDEDCGLWTCSLDVTFEGGRGCNAMLELEWVKITSHWPTLVNFEIHLPLQELMVGHRHVTTAVFTFVESFSISTPFPHWRKVWCRSPKPTLT